MSARTVFRVVPAGAEAWHVQVLGNTIYVRTTQTAARNFAVDLASRLWHRDKILAQVVLHRRDGRIKCEYTYGEDPWEKEG